MKYLKILLIFILPLTLQGCLNLRSCSDEISGKFICENNPNASNYLQLNTDGTFLHYYQENSLTLTHEGTWKKSDDGHCILEFSEWKNYNNGGENFEEFGNGLLWINGEHLDIGPDGESSTSFVKVQD